MEITIDSGIGTENVIAAADDWLLERAKHLVEEQSKKFHFKNNANVQKLVKLIGELKPFNVLNASNLNEENRPELLEKVKAIASDILSENFRRQRKMEDKRDGNMDNFNSGIYLHLLISFELFQWLSEYFD